MNRRQTLQRLAPLAGLALLGASMGLSGCTGWRVRGGALSFDFQSILILSPEQQVNIDRGDPGTTRYPQVTSGGGLVPRLRQELRARHKKTLVETILQAQVVLKIKRIETRKLALSFTSAGQVREFELRMELDYSIEDNNGRILTPDASLEVVRTLATLETTTLATSNEEASQLASMEVFLVQQIIRQLAALRNAPPSTRPQTP